jgi:hypothetical protein
VNDELLLFNLQYQKSMTSMCHTPCMHATQRCTCNSSSESRTLASHHEETLGKHDLTAIGVRGRDSYYQLIRASHTRKSEFALEFEPPPRAIQIRYYRPQPYWYRVRLS